jgi:hypothetical protein
MTRWLYFISGLIIIILFSGLYYVSSNPICWLPVALVVGDGLRTSSFFWDEPNVERHEESDTIINFKRNNKEVNLFTDVFIKEEEFKV